MKSTSRLSQLLNHLYDPGIALISTAGDIKCDQACLRGITDLNWGNNLSEIRLSIDFNDHLRRVCALFRVSPAASLRRSSSQRKVNQRHKRDKKKKKQALAVDSFLVRLFPRLFTSLVC